MHLECVTFTIRESGFIACYFGQEDVCIVIGYINQYLKEPPMYYCAQPHRYWWKMRFMFNRLRYYFSRGCLVGDGAVPGTWN